MRERILDAAEQVIRGDGLTRATTQRIAMAAGCSEGTIYRHFRSKEDVFIAILAERVPKFLIAMRSVSDKTATSDTRSNLALIMRSALDFYNVTIPITAALFSDPRLMARRQEWMRENDVWLHPLTELTRYVACEQAARGFAAEAAPQSIAGQLLGACYLRAYGKQFTAVSPLSDKTFINDTITCLFDGVSA
jgi:AcrR family transcriptional regulator